MITRQHLLSRDWGCLTPYLLNSALHLLSAMLSVQMLSACPLQYTVDTLENFTLLLQKMWCTGHVHYLTVLQCNASRCAGGCSAALEQNIVMLSKCLSLLLIIWSLYVTQGGVNRKWFQTQTESDGHYEPVKLFIPYINYNDYIFVWLWWHSLICFE